MDGDPSFVWRDQTSVCIVQTAKSTYLVNKMFGASINYSIELIPSFLLMEINY